MLARFGVAIQESILSYLLESTNISRCRLAALPSPRRKTVVHIFFRLRVELRVAVAIFKQQQRDGEVILLGEDGHFTHWLREPDIRPQFDPGASVDDRILAARQ